jgi:hypothetical protein
MSVTLDPLRTAQQVHQGVPRIDAAGAGARLTRATGPIDLAGCDTA